jgi:hypothetical protein
MNSWAISMKSYRRRRNAWNGTVKETYSKLVYVSLCRVIHRGKKSMGRGLVVSSSEGCNRFGNIGGAELGIVFSQTWTTNNFAGGDRERRHQPKTEPHRLLCRRCGSRECFFRLSAQLRLSLSLSLSFSLHHKHETYKPKSRPIVPFAISITPFFNIENGAAAVVTSTRIIINTHAHRDHIIFIT